MEDRLYCVYIMSNKWDTVFYVGSTGRLKERVAEHTNGLVEGFTKRYHLTKLVYYECGGDHDGSLTRERQIKRWNRKKKLALITSMNPKLRDLVDELD